MEKERIIFIHIPKAAGRTMHSIVARQYRSFELHPIEGRLSHTDQPSEADLTGVRLIIGLVHYGLHERLSSPSSYATLLRDPVERVLSLYRYIASNPKHFLHAQVVREGVLQFVSGDADLEEVENGQTRQIAGVTSGVLNDKDLERAKKYLENDFCAVGVVECFDESLILLKRKLGWRLPLYAKKNVTPGVDGHHDVSDEVIDIILQRNRLDLELYGFARRLLEREVRDAGFFFRAEVACFRILNRGAQGFIRRKQLIR